MFSTVEHSNVWITDVIHPVTLKSHVWHKGDYSVLLGFHWINEISNQSKRSTRLVHFGTRVTEGYLFLRGVASFGVCPASHSSHPGTILIPGWQRSKCWLGGTVGKTIISAIRLVYHVSEFTLELCHVVNGSQVLFSWIEKHKKLYSIIHSFVNFVLPAESIPDAIKTECAGCSPKQKEGAERVMKYLHDNKKEEWNALLDKFDPDGSLRAKYKDKADSIFG